MIERFDIILLLDIRRDYKFGILEENGIDAYGFYEESVNELSQLYDILEYDYATIDWETVMRLYLKQKFLYECRR